MSYMTPVSRQTHSPTTLNLELLRFLSLALSGGGDGSGSSSALTQFRGRPAALLNKLPSLLRLDCLPLSFPLAPPLMLHLVSISSLFGTSGYGADAVVEGC